MIDVILLALYVIMVDYLRNKDSSIMLVSFGLSVLYTSSSLFDIHSAWMNHLIVSMIFLPALILTAKRVSIAVCVYTVFQWLTAGEYLFSDSSTYIIGIFEEVALSINLLIMAALIYERYNSNYHKSSMLGDSWVINLCIHRFQNSSRKDKGAGC